MGEIHFIDTNDVTVCRNRIFCFIFKDTFFLLYIIDEIFKKRQFNPIYLQYFENIIKISSLFNLTRQCVEIFLDLIWTMVNMVVKLQNRKKLLSFQT